MAADLRGRVHQTGDVADRAAVAAAYRRHVNRGLGRLADVMGLPLEVRSTGSIVVDERGDEFLDCGGYGVFILGHCHPRVVDAVGMQLLRHPLATRVLLSPELAEAAEALVSVAPAGLDYVFFTNSGAEATEAALKIARLNGKRRILATDGGFHGKTLGALSVTGRERFRSPFEPLLADVDFVPFGDASAMASALADRGDSTAVLLEPVQAEGGVVVPPRGYLKAVEELCREYGALLLLDEIQTGLGRLGTWWGADRESVVPDVLLVGKGLSGGVVPVGAVVCTPAVFEPLNRDPLLHTSTFGGNPLAAVAARAAIETIRDERAVERAGMLGERLLARLSKLPRTSETVVAVRGVGLLIGIEFCSEHAAGDCMLELLDRRVIVSHSLNAHAVVRLTPSAFLDETEVMWLLNAVEDAVATVDKRWRQRTKEGAR